MPLPGLAQCGHLSRMRRCQRGFWQPAPPASPRALDPQARYCCPARIWSRGMDGGQRTLPRLLPRNQSDLLVRLEHITALLRAMPPQLHFIQNQSHHDAPEALHSSPACRSDDHADEVDKGTGKAIRSRNKGLGDREAPGEGHPYTGGPEAPRTQRGVNGFYSGGFQSHVGLGDGGRHPGVLPLPGEELLPSCL